MYLKRTEAEIEGQKRQHFPYVVVSQCPLCKRKLEMDFSSEYYLGEPIFDEPETISIYCYDCGKEIKEISVIPRITLELNQQ